ncbi:hypothetical protein LNO75_00395 [Mycoplasma sp. T363T]|uniref:hypothetical protein n=1 Tax=Mycoplasma bradburyae TaxID=2963128 RepID=UPI0020CDA0F2|nr:hypothetical protein [Mycoplasma bradburyae]MDC4163040.1 hypothetical protein [Mycoplasma bradburyae]UTS70559.1 hypothetical protein NMG77_02280 [Mycoplasma bradburyae]
MKFLDYFEEQKFNKISIFINQEMINMPELKTFKHVCIFAVLFFFHKSEKEIIFGNINFLIYLTGLKKSSVYKALEDLSKAGLLKITKNSDKTTEYKLLLSNELEAKLSSKNNKFFFLKPWMNKLPELKTWSIRQIFAVIYSIDLFSSFGHRLVPRGLINNDIIFELTKLKKRSVFASIDQLKNIDFIKSVKVEGRFLNKEFNKWYRGEYESYQINKEYFFQEIKNDTKQLLSTVEFDKLS